MCLVGVLLPSFVARSVELTFFSDCFCIDFEKPCRLFKKPCRLFDGFFGGFLGGFLEGFFNGFLILGSGMVTFVAL